MATYTSIRLYISSTASILPNGFYDVIGFYGPQVGDSTNPYHLDKDFNNPVIKTNGQYYYLTYRDADGFIPTMVEAGNSELHLLTGATSMPIYLSQRDDAHIISNYDKPLVNNITFDNIDNLYAAYRLLYVDVYENYAIERFDSIMDNDNIIDVVDADFILAAQNPDGINIIPPPGNVASLKDFELTFRDNITATDISLLRKIALYDYNTQSVAIGVDVNSIVYNLGGNTVTFSLLSEITNPSQYFLYIPSGAFTYETGVLSKMAMFAYTIRSQQGGGDVWEFIYSPTQTKSLSKVTMTFVNVASIVGLRNISTLTVTAGNNTTSYSVGDLAEAFGNSIKIELPEPITASVSNVTCSITFAANSIQVQTGNWNESAITLNVDVVTEDTTLPTDDARYGISISPQEGEVYEVRYLNIMVKIAQGNYGVVDINDGHALDEIVVHEGDTTEGAIVDQVDNVSIKNQYTDEEGNLVYEYDCVFRNHNKSASAYTIYIPNELFTITLSSSGGSETLYSGSYELKYTIKPEDPESGEEENPNGPTLNFGYKLLMIKGTPGSIARDVAFRRGDTILINRDKFALMATSPCLTVTRFDHDNGETVTSKGTLIPTSGDIMDITLRMTYYNSDNVEVSTTATLNYGIQLGTVVYTDMGGIFPMLRSSGYPNYMRLYYIFQYNGTELTHELELQFIPNYIYTKVKENPNWKINLRFDLYSGVQTDYQWGCMFLTHQYDCILNYKKEIPDPEDPEAEPTIETHYIAELVPTTKVRTGNLAGIYNEKFGANQPQGYGLYGENVYLTGNFYLNNGKSLMDISDDILLATGDINEIRDGLSNLDTSVKATIEALSLRQETFEHGLDASIKNYISTNKNAVLKIGLDYSIWALGSAGITMVNPNATYDFDPITGNYSVNPDTVGDGDEYINLQGSKIVINTYCHDWLVDAEDDTEKEFQEVIATTVNPELWEYDADGSIYIPKRNGVPVAFIRGYVESLEGITIASVSQTEETHEMLKYANFWPAEIKNSKVVDEALGGFRAWGEPNDTTEVYAFTTFYMDTGDSHRIKVKREYDGETTLVNLIDYADASTVYFVPRLEQSGLFKDGKFNSKYIEAENLVAVDIKDDTYIKNRRFDPTQEIKDTNYPVLRNDGTKQPAKDANFVVVSGTTGKLTAKGADIRGSITIGDHENDNDTFVAISDNKGDHKIEDENYPALYILKHHVPDKNEILAKFSGNEVRNVESLYTSVDTRTIDRTIHPSIDKTYTLEYSPQNETVYDDDDYNNNMPYYGDDEWGNTPGTANQNTPHTHGNGTTYYWYYAYYRTTGSTRAESPVYYTQEVTSFDLGPNESKTIALEGTMSIHGTASSNSRSGQLTVNGNLLVRPSGSTQFRNIIYLYKSSAYTTGAITVDDSTTLTLHGTRVTVKNNNGQNSVTYEIILEVSVSYSCSWNTTKTTGTPTQPSGNPIYVSASATIAANYKIQEGGDGYVANFFGNGIAIGFNGLNNFYTYYKKGANTSFWDKDQMLISFKSNGVGMSFENGSFYHHIADHMMPGYIPLLVGKVRYNDYFYYFDGRSLLNNGGYSYGSNYSQKLVMQYAPYYSNYFHDADWWEELWGGYDVNHMGLQANTSTNTNALIDDDKYNCIYNSTHDIYIVRVDYGVITILFGNKWNTIFGGGNIFVREDTLKISAVGIGKDSWDGTVSVTTRVPVGSLFITAKPPITNNNRIQVDANRRPTLFMQSNPDSAYNVTYDEGSTNQPTFCNALCFNIADDAALNDGTFYLTLEVCPNMVVS